MNHVTIRKATLCGFGLYREPVTFAFPSTLGVLAGPNESGKSTLVHGLIAILFGLRRESDVSGFSTARFKNWDSPAGFWGELEFTASGKLFRLRREFEVHETTLSSEGSDGANLEFKGEHNPAAHKNPESRQYVQALRDILGIGDRRLFESIFCIRQDPGSAEAGSLDRSVQSLIAGSGERSSADVVKVLVDAFKRVTCETGKYEIAMPGVRPTDGRKEQDLELVQGEIRETERSLESSSGTLAGLAELRKNLAQKEKVREDTGSRHKAEKETLEAWNEWGRVRSERSLKEKAQGRLARRISDCKKQEAEQGELRARIEREYPEFKTFPPDLEEDLDTLISLAGRRADDLEQRKKVRSQLDEAKTKTLAAQKEQGARYDWSAVGPKPRSAVTQARERVKSFVEDHGLYQEQAARLEDIDRETKKEFRLFEDASPETLRVLEDLELTQARLGRRVELEEERRALEESIRKDFGPEVLSRDRSEDFLNKLGRKADLERDLSEKGERLQKIEHEYVAAQDRRRRKAVVWGFLGLAAGVVLSVFLELGTGTEIGLMLALGIFVGSAAFLMIRPKLLDPQDARTFQTLSREVVSTIAALAEINEELKIPANVSPGMLGELKEKLRRLRDLEKKIEFAKGTEKGGSSAGTLGSLEDFEKQMAPFRAQFGENLATACDRWKDLKSEAQELAGRIEAHLEKYFGTHREWESSSVQDLPADWVPVFAVARAEGREPDDVSDLVRWVMDLQTDDWSGLEKGLTDWEGNEETLKNLVRDRKLLETTLEELDGKIARADEDAGKMSKKLETWLNRANGDPSEVKAKLRSYREVASELKTSEQVLQGTLENEGVDSIGALEQKKMSMDNEIMTVIGEERKLRTEHASLERASELGDPLLVGRYHSEMRSEVEALARTIDQTEQEVRKLGRDIARLEGENVVDIAAEEIRLHSLIDRRDRLIMERDALRLAYEVTVDAIRHYQEDHQEILEKRTNETFAALTLRPERRVELASDFSPRVVEKSGAACSIEQLSQGAQDQLHLSIRLAVAEMISGEMVLPFIFDDPFLTFDRERMAVLRDTLLSISKNRQVILLTHREELERWGEAVEQHAGI